jgi:hypothetical protein
MLDFFGDNCFVNETGNVNVFATATMSATATTAGTTT